jgi:hypothetical protein
MLGQKDNLPDVLRVVRDLPVDGLQDGMGLAADGYGAHDVIRFKRIDGAEDAGPSLFPPRHYFCARGRGAQFKFPVAKAIRLFSIRREEIRETRAHVAGYMFDQNRDRVGFPIESDEEVLIAQLRHGAFAHALVPVQLPAGFVEIMTGCIAHADDSPENCRELVTPTSATRCFDCNPFAFAQSRAGFAWQGFRRTVMACQEGLTRESVLCSR